MFTQFQNQIIKIYQVEYQPGSHIDEVTYHHITASKNNQIVIPFGLLLDTEMTDNYLNTRYVIVLLKENCINNEVAQDNYSMYFLFGILFPSCGMCTWGLRKMEKIVVDKNPSKLGS